MNNQEAKKAFDEKVEVYYRDLKFKKINALIYRKYGDEFYSQAECQDMNADAVYVVPVEKLEFTEEKIIYPEKFSDEEKENINNKIVDTENKLNLLTNTIISENITRSIEHIYSLIQNLLGLEEILQRYEDKKENAKEEIQEIEKEEIQENK